MITVAVACMPDTAAITKALYSHLFQLINGCDLTNKKGFGFQPKSTTGVDWCCRRAVLQTLGANSLYPFDKLGILMPNEDPDSKALFEGIKRDAAGLEQFIELLVKQEFEFLEYTGNASFVYGVYAIGGACLNVVGVVSFGFDGCYAGHSRHHPNISWIPRKLSSYYEFAKLQDLIPFGPQWARPRVGVGCHPGLGSNGTQGWGSNANGDEPCQTHLPTTLFASNPTPNSRPLGVCGQPAQRVCIFCVPSEGGQLRLWRNDGALATS